MWGLLKVQSSPCSEQCQDVALAEQSLGFTHSTDSDEQICDGWEEEVAQFICKKIRQHVKLFLDQEAGVNWNSGLYALFQGKSLFFFFSMLSFPHKGQLMFLYAFEGCLETSAS